MKNSLRIGLALGGGMLAALAWFLMRWDRAALNVLYIRPVLMLDTVRVFSYAGSWMVTVPVVVLSLAVLWRPGWIWLALRPLGALALAELVAEGVKFFVHRPRPDAIAQIGDYWGFSFPSDHAMAALALWLALAQVIGELWPEGRGLLFTVAGLFGLLGGWSQIYLGVSWPADVVAGWAFALILIALFPGPFPPQAGRVRRKK